VVVAKDSIDTTWEINNCTDITLKKKLFGNGVLNGWCRSRNERIPSRNESRLPVCLLKQSFFQ
jgi:hypothetical protein